ncbi:hypothetical protein VTK73DRAFT_1641 [Phialemonium thermophilum]|uniref:Phosphoadenosine phosphosulphate reductase domain-containing protein n=1 Tax=Phialemonium thermophilum TaxID=223376 RepID=A0ABR3VT96_9PEZI
MRLSAANASPPCRADDPRPEQISISYNGGKDCLVLTLLVLSCLPRHFLPESDSLVPPPTSSSSSPSPSAGHHAPSTKSSPNGTGPAATPGAPTPSAGPPRPGPFPESLQAVYIVPPHPFPEVDRFVASSGREFHLQLAKYNLPMRAALESYRLENPQIEAVFVGTVSRPRVLFFFFCFAPLPR